MPFVTDKLADINESKRQARYQKQAMRASRFAFSPVEVMAHLRANIVGQIGALEQIEDALYVIKADIGESNRPLTVCMLLGPTGVGKTETVRLLAEAINGDAKKVCRIDMNTLAQEHYSAAITGAPPGYVGSKEGQTLFDVDAIKGSYSQPGIVLFDEIEKASRDVVRALLNLIDTGKLVLSSGVKEIDFSNALIFMTSNLGAKEYSQTLLKHQRGWRKWLGIQLTPKVQIIERAVHDHFDPEFINRIDKQLHYNAIESSWFNKIVDNEIQKLNRRLKKRSADLIIDNSVYLYLSKKYDHRFGARDVRRLLRNELEPKLARALIEYEAIERFIAKVDSGEIAIGIISEHGEAVQ